MDMHFEFTDVRADRERDYQPSATEDVRAGDVDAQAEAGQQLRGATDAATLASGRDHEALAERDDASRRGDSLQSDTVPDERAVAADTRQPIKSRVAEVTDADDPSGLAYPSQPADRSQSLDAHSLRYPDHVRVFTLETPDADSSDTTKGDHLGNGHEVIPNGADATTHRFATDMHGTTADESGNTTRVHEDVAERLGEAGGAPEQGAAAAKTEEEGGGKNALARALGSALRMTGHVISDASSKALDAYRQGPGEHMIEDQLEKTATKVGKQALKDEVRAAKRGAPWLQRQYAANNVRWHAGREIEQNAKRAYKDAVRARWQEIDKNAGEEADESDIPE